MFGDCLLGSGQSDIDVADAHSQELSDFLCGVSVAVHSEDDAVLLVARIHEIVNPVGRLLGNYLVLSCNPVRECRHLDFFIIFCVIGDTAGVVM